MSMMRRVSFLLLEVRLRRHRVIPTSNCNCRPSSNSLVRKYYAVVSLMLWTFLGGSNAFYLPTKAFYFDLHLRSANYAPSSYRFGTITTASQTVKCYSVSLRGSDANLDTLEKEILNEQSSQSKFNKSSRLSKKRSKSRRKNWERKPFSTNPSDAKSYTYSRRGGHSSHGKRGRRNRTALEDAQVMPPWLSRYENEDFATSTFYLGGASQSTSVRKPSEQDVSHVQRLHLALNGIFRQSSASENTSTSTTDMLPVTTPYFTKAEIHEIMDAIRVASHENTNLMAGCADFLYMMLTLEEEGVLNSSSESLIKEQWDDDDISSFGYLDWENGPERMDGGLPEPFSIMTRDVLVAAAFHYCDCVRARKAGVYDYARQAMEASLDMTAWKEREVEKRELLSLPPHVVDQPDRMDMDPERHKKHDIGVITTQATIPVMENEAAMIVGTKSIRNSPLDYYGDESVKIVADAARLKRAEIMATTVHSSGSLITKGAASKSKADAEILRSFLVSLSEDWRALVIRSAACLYRLKGITDELDDTNMSTRSALNRSTNTVARDAFKVYAPLAQRLGMQRLKSDLENRAFRILYPR